MIESSVQLIRGHASVRDAEITFAQEAAFRALAGALPLAVLVTDVLRERVLYANRRFQELWSSPEDASMSELLDAMTRAAADPHRLVSLWHHHQEPGQLDDEHQSFLLLSNGVQLRWRSVPLLGLNEGQRGEIHLFEEIPAHRATHDRSQNDLFRLTFEKAAVGMTLISSDLRFLRANPSFCRMLGYDEKELLELRIPDLVPGDEPHISGEWSDALVAGQESFHVTLRFSHRDRDAVWAHLSVSVVRDSDQRPVYFVALAEDITVRMREEAEREKQTRELLALASTDSLTGLYNHRYMVDCLSRLISESKRSGQPLSVLMLDLDEFRELNERYGHDAGNRALCCLADCMRQSLREGDVACRYGGDEFVIILNGVPLTAAMLAAERVRKRVQETGLVAPLAEPITCSIGVASYPANASTAASLLKAADVALYESKHSGKNQVRAYQPPPVAGALEDLEKLKSGLQGANLEAVKTLVTAIDLRDRYTGAHCQRVARLSLELAARLGVSEQDMEILRLGAPLIDVGKIGLPDSLLTKVGRLTQAEWSLMRQHPVWGEQLVRRSALPAATLELVRWHHERQDGSGYPDGLTGDQIPPLVRIVVVADVASALREDRPHRRAWPRDRVLEYLRRHADSKLDSEVVRACCDLYEGR